MHADPYATLGVWHDDRTAAILGAFQDLMRRFHAVTDARPPYHRAVADAFAALSSGPDMPELGEPPIRDATPIDLLDDFAGGRPSREEVWALFRSNFTSYGPPKSGRIDLLELEVRGPERPTVIQLELPVFHPCPACHGSGSTALHGCAACDGTGVAEDRAAAVVRLTPGTETVVPLAPLGVLTPALRIRLIA
jgi:hypothetical protein